MITDSRIKRKTQTITLDEGFNAVVQHGRTTVELKAGGDVVIKTDGNVSVSPIEKRTTAGSLTERKHTIILNEQYNAVVRHGRTTVAMKIGGDVEIKTNRNVKVAPVEKPIWEMSLDEATEHERKYSFSFGSLNGERLSRGPR